MPAFKTIVVTVKELDAAKALYAEVLEAQPHTDQPYYVGFNVDGCEFGLTPQRSEDQPTGAMAFVDVPDAAAKIDQLKKAGASVIQEPTDVGGGTRIAILADAEGNPFGLRSAS